ncbi:BRF1 domain-containing protein [Cephalotus follicularis]|uniref:BRF1 domain-containing protein n=1 Tax=Cephalotus follicularis TaxID=3775 RepID=A0A1Q3B3Q1_CEPFO|nr:BRF1 domain-containing protein [Cephalotus follicularis]
MHQKNVESSSKVRINAVTKQVLALRLCKSNRKCSADKGASTRHRNLVEIASRQLPRHKSSVKMVDDDLSEDLSDIGDAEVIGYLHNKKAVHLKETIWEIINKGYLMGRQNNRATKVKKATPAKKAPETVGKIEHEKRLSSKINYDVLKKLINEPEVPEKSNEISINSEGDSYGDMRQVKKKPSLEVERHSFGESVDEDEDEYRVDVDAGGDHFGDMNLENEEEYLYETGSERECVREIEVGINQGMSLWVRDRV